jgi:hypothetical protein
MKRIFILLLSILTIGCGSDGETIKAPSFYFGYGAKVQIGDSESATAFGYDKCPAQGQGVLLGGDETKGHSCVMLSSEGSVKVRLISSKGHVFIEQWLMSQEYNNVAVIRPNGWVIKQAL